MQSAPQLRRGTLRPGQAACEVTRVPRVSRPVRITAAHAASKQASSTAKWQESFVLENPFLNSKLEVFDVHGKAVPVRELAGGRTVLGLLRHLGCPMCWEQAANLLQLKPQFEEHGYRLAVVAIGSPESGRKVCNALEFPEELLFLDPDRNVYRELQLNAGGQYFFNKATVGGLTSLDPRLMKDVMSRYFFIKPPNVEMTLQMGGMYVVDGPKLLYAHMDKGFAAHAPNKDLLAACCSGPVTAR